MGKRIWIPSLFFVGLFHFGFGYSVEAATQGKPGRQSTATVGISLTIPERKSEPLASSTLATESPADLLAFKPCSNISYFQQRYSDLPHTLTVKAKGKNQQLTTYKNLSAMCANNTEIALPSHIVTVRLIPL